MGGVSQAGGPCSNYATGVDDQGDETVLMVVGIVLGSVFCCIGVFCCVKQLHRRQAEGWEW